MGGASQGIGLATATVLAEKGARVILMSRRSDVLESVRSKLPNASQHRVLPVDLERIEDISAPLNRHLNDVGQITIWVNNTGGPKAGALIDASSDEMERAFRGHVLASQMILRALLPGMKAAGYGRIINLLSTSVKIPIPNIGVSNIMRSAMAAWAKTLVMELGPFGITVNNVLPGYTQTPRLDALVAGSAQRLQVSPEEVKAEWTKSIPLQRLADPRETAEAIAFLASPEAAYISGVQLPVDGGRTGAF